MLCHHADIEEITQHKIPHFQRLYRYRKCQGNFLFEFLTHFLYLYISPFQVISSFAGNATFKNVKEYFVHISGTFPALIHATFPGNFHSCRKCHISWNWKCQGNFLVYISDTFPVLLHITLPSNFQLCRKFHNHILPGTFSVLVHTTFPGDFQLCGNFKVICLHFWCIFCISTYHLLR